MPSRSVKSNGILGSQMIIELESVVVLQTYKITVLTLDRPGYQEYKFVDESCFPGPTFIQSADSVRNSTSLTPRVGPGVFEDWEAARVNVTSVSPPRPPPKKVKVGYNPGLDNPRPADLHEYLSVFQVMFIVDDSDSMKGERWNKTRDALATIPDHAFVDTVSLGLRFLNNKRKINAFQSKESLMSLFDTVTPRGKTPLGKALKTVFDTHLKRIDSAIKKGKNEYSKIRPLNIVVLTDGMPTDDPANVIKKAVKRLNNSHYHPNTMSIQIVQIGNEELAKRKLGDLVSGDNGGIVDVVPLENNLDSEKLQRILLRGVHPNTRQLLQLPTDSKEDEFANPHQLRVLAGTGEGMSHHHISRKP